MGYTHYWTQTRILTADEWQDITADIGDILKYVQHMAGVPLANAMAEPRTVPEITPLYIGFNGVGDDGHETFAIAPKPDDEAFCKTARKPYDLAVTACLCYLSTCLDPATFTVSSDGHGHNFLDGLDAARKALPRKANVLDIPRGVMAADRWTGPWVRGYDESGFDVNFCVNGKAYVTQTKTGATYCFATHRALAEFLDGTKAARFARGGSTGWGSYPATEPNIWNASGSFDKARHARIAKAQAKVLAKLFPVSVEHAEQPPAFVRPMEFLRPEEEGTFCYSLDELLSKAAA